MVRVQEVYFETTIIVLAFPSSSLSQRVLKLNLQIYKREPSMFL
jgi:hypothetical protein